MLEIRPSMLNILKFCTGCVLLRQETPPTKPSPAAEEGTLAHSVLEDLLYQRPVNVDPEMLMYCKAAYDYIAVHSKGAPLSVEERTRLEWLHYNVHGTPDVTWYDPATRTFHVYDLKYGYMPVEAVDNWQLLAYATKRPAETEFIKLHIYQPRAYSKEGPSKTDTLPRKQFEERIIDIRNAIMQALNPATAICTAGGHCRGCSCFATCNTFDRAMKSAFDLTGHIESDNNNLSLQLVLLRQIATMSKKKLERLESMIEGRLEKGEVISGVNVKPSYGALKWNNSESEVKQMCEMLGIQAYKNKLLTPKQVIESGVPEAAVKGMASRSFTKKLTIMTNEEVAKWLNC